MIKIGLKKAFYAIQTKDDPGSVLYNVPVALPGLQQIGVNPKVNKTQVASDDIISADISQCLGADVNVQREYFSLAEEAILLGRAVDANGGVFGGESDKAPYVAFGYMRTFSEGQVLCVWLLKTKFAPSNSTADTKEAGGIKPQFDTYSASSITRTADGQWIYSKLFNNEAAAAGFFTKATLEALANVANQSYGNPANVEFVDELPVSGEPGVIYILPDNTSHYWDGSKFVQNGEEE